MDLATLLIDYNTYNLRVRFDRLENFKIKESLQVVTANTIRGKNKTFNSYLKPIVITFTGYFSDKVANNIIIKSNKEEGVAKINRLIGQEKTNQLKVLFNSFIEDTRLLNVRTFYKTYENYVIRNFSISYINNSSIKVDLELQEMLLRNENADFSPLEVNYHNFEIPSKEEQTTAETVKYEIVTDPNTHYSYKRIVD